MPLPKWDTKEADEPKYKEVQQHSRCVISYPYKPTDENSEDYKAYTMAFEAVIKESKKEQW